MPHTIMIIDDSRDDRYIAARQLRKFYTDVTILEADDGVHAIQMLESADAQPSLIFLDINMPRMDGHEFLQAWYEDRGLKVPVVVMLTSSDQTMDIERTQAYGCVKDYFIKPMSREHMDLLNELLEDPAHASQTAAG